MCNAQINYDIVKVWQGFANIKVGFFTDRIVCFVRRSTHVFYLSFVIKVPISFIFYRFDRNKGYFYVVNFNEYAWHE